MLERGLVQVYTGMSRGFNFAPVGLTFRAAGHGFRSRYTEFTPHAFMSELHIASARLKPNLQVDHSAIEPGRFDSSEVLRRMKTLAAFKRSRDAVFSRKFDIVVLSGILEVISQGIVPISAVMDLVEGKPPEVELVLSGDEAPRQIVQKADLVTYMDCRSRPQREKSAGGVEVVTGHGKGKTTYCLGKAMLTSCRGTAVRVLQFIKSPQAYGELKAVMNFPQMSIQSMGEGFVGSEPQEKKHLDAARKAWEECLKETYSLRYGMVVLDEINTATHFGLLDPEDVRELCLLKPKGLHLLLSGRHVHPRVANTATVVINMEKVKHPYDRGIQARRGIEY